MHEPYLKRRIRRDDVGDTSVSTVYLGGLFASNEEYETMVFGEDHPMDKYIKRYRSLEEAVKGHEKILELVKQGRAAPKRRFLEDQDSV